MRLQLSCSIYMSLIVFVIMHAVLIQLYKTIQAVYFI